MTGANLVRHVQPESYYARIHARGKLIWKSLKALTISKVFPAPRDGCHQKFWRGNFEICFSPRLR
jgi:hypothetical protein